MKSLKWSQDYMEHEAVRLKQALASEHEQAAQLLADFDN